MATAFVERCKATYYAIRDDQMARADEYAIGYDTDRDLYFDKVEPRVLYRDVIRQVAREVRVERDAERAELERWQRAEQDHYAVWVDETVVDVVAETVDVLFLTRYAAMVWSALERRRRASAGWPAGWPARRPAIVCHVGINRRDALARVSSTCRDVGLVDARPPPRLTCSLNPH